MPVSTNPYKGPWTRNQVIHLLKRTMFGARIEDINYFQRRTLEQTIDELLQPQKGVTPPVNNYNTGGYVDTTGVKLGETWVTAAYGDGNDNGRRRSSLKSWWVGQMLNQQRSLEEKMLLFWHNHLATEMDVVDDARYLYKYHNLLRTFTFGNFKTLVRQVSVDPAMLIYLNGFLNTATAPDENYARELFELFALGKGPNSKYTEDDVKAAARVLTGYQVSRTNVAYTFNAGRHDNKDKQFSSFFGNRVIKGQTGANGEKELDELIDMTFAQNEVAMFICRKLYRFFFYYEITAEVEEKFITPLAKVFRDANYEIRPLLRAMFLSEHFFDTQISGALIKGPLDSVVGLCRETAVVFPDPVADVEGAYSSWNNIRGQASTMQQDIGDPPNVSGWQAYYQEPQFHELWINTDTYPKRKTYTDRMVGTDRAPQGFTSSNRKLVAVDALAFAKRLPNPEEPNLLIDQILEVFYRYPVPKETKDAWKRDILLKGQSSDYYWTDAWNAHIARPTDAAAKTLVESYLRQLLNAIVSEPEYQLS
jgi:uncharacterized protein (DUF1800 family)